MRCALQCASASCTDRSIQRIRFHVVQNTSPIGRGEVRLTFAVAPLLSPALLCRDVAALAKAPLHALLSLCHKLAAQEQMGRSSGPCHPAAAPSLSRLCVKRASEAMHEPSSQSAPSPANAPTRHTACMHGARFAVTSSISSRPPTLPNSSLLCTLTNFYLDLLLHNNTKIDTHSDCFWIPRRFGH
jgi:hypothetical protein